MNTLTIKRIFMCLVALLAAFGAWYVTDPQLATFQGADPRNVKANESLPMYHLIVYVTYMMAVWVTWICTEPGQRTRPYERDENEKQGET